MTKPGNRTFAAALALVAAAGGTLAIAASPADTIAARQANFKKMGGAMKVIKDELAGGADKAKMAGAAKTIAAVARAQVPLFPKGTGPGAGVKTDALPAIWTDRATFDGHAKKLIAEADKLVMATGTGNAMAIGAQRLIAAGQRETS
ncbi:MAG: cytochrome c [Novosphingobium sp.]|nr:cytochrome c [Novosphingobium sp.]